MPSTLPDGDPVPADGTLPVSALADLARRPFEIYLHVPFCTTRCGYCDFNTYTADQLGTAPGATRGTYMDAALTELALARRVLGPDAPAVSTVFVGGGTPTLLPAGDLVRFLDGVRDTFGLAAGAEVTTEANPESIDAEGLAELAEGGFTRISFGMQSADEQVLRLLDRVHTPGRAAEMVGLAREAGFRHVSLDLIYGTPGESIDSWRRSLRTALAAGPDHLSAYALIVEEGTRFAVRVRRGEIAMTDDDDLADKYLVAEEELTAAGLSWYEVSNWARTPDDRCHHNLGYWRAADWWGIGPGAHSHIGGVRFWNRKHPAAYARALAEGRTPAQGREILTAEQCRVERVLLELRLADGLSLEVLTATEARRVPDLVVRGLANVHEAAGQEQLVLTLRGRLLADGIVRDLLD
ncbi:radical SAM family heme chaperone HemW [Raineyella sp. LH-20]|uniref:radical SAM family heme chaperone HemW n=1 Tax=Raineyella sp. LH-20 TaxID=3081204 RepID=UPI0029532D8E|nr:radical SAM family heme chaperone HemW [Raineyella sp. LH-20]WOP17771.1 radical SAM family heme chaperone HemW [Raineyella sp. LH-20]